MNKLFPMPTLAIVTLIITACSPSDNPRLAMCQNITKNVVGSIDSWEEPKISEGREMVIKAAYQASSGDAGEVNCMFKGDDNGYQTAPAKVAINGKALTTKELITAGTKATGEQLKGLADETKKQSKVLAEQAEEKAGELSVKAEELAGKAGELAKQAGEAAVEAANETSQKVQEALK